MKRNKTNKTMVVTIPLTNKSIDHIMKLNSYDHSQMR